MAEFATSFTPERDVFTDAFSAALTRDDTLVLVAPDDADICGYLLANVHSTFFANAPVAWVEEVMVDEALRRSGVGGDLMAAAETWAREQGAASLRLEVNHANGHAKGVYLRRGFGDDRRDLMTRWL